MPENVLYKLEPITDNPKYEGFASARLQSIRGKELLAMDFMPEKKKGTQLFSIVRRKRGRSSFLLTGGRGVSMYCSHATTSATSSWRSGLPRAQSGSGAAAAVSEGWGFRGLRARPARGHGQAPDAA